MSASLCHHLLTKVAASYRNFGKQSLILASVNKSLVNLHMGTYMLRSCAHVQVVLLLHRSRSNLRQWMLVPGPPNLQQLVLVVFFIPATSANTLPALVVVTLCNLPWWSFS